MQLILTHDKSDFDAVASQVAAWKLEPEAVPVRAARLNRNVHAFVTLHERLLPLVAPDELPEPLAATGLILVDTQGIPAVKGLDGEAAKRLPVRVYDHHERRDDLPETWQAQIEPTGSATTLLIEKLIERGIVPTWVEATLFLLGIHEDTGSLTYGGTTVRDMRAALWLMERGADLDLLRRHLDHPLTERQRDLYRLLMEGAELIERDGYRLLLATATATDYVDDIASLASSLRDLYDPAALVVAVSMNDNVYLVARSTTDDVDVDALMDRFGGGGHTRAAAAFIKHGSLEAIGARLRSALPEAVRPAVAVADWMSRGPIRTLPHDGRIRDAALLMRRWGHEGFPVVGPQGEVVGVLTRRDVDRALQHQLEGAPLSDFMHKGTLTVRPSDGITRVEQVMAEQNIGQVPVVADEGGPLIGIVTRTDLLKRAAAHRAPRPRERDLMARLAALVAPSTLALLRRIAQEAAAQGSAPFLVGGPVRDLLLGVPLRDLDVVVEGQALPVARALAGALGGRLVLHERFGTAKWLLRDPDHPSRDALLRAEGLPAHIDLITARTEFYERPSAMPQVEHASIQQDLHRRDFTINTLALSLHPDSEGRLLDFYGGERDLREKRLRVLHNLSFVEDPTRILRAVRFEQRFGLTIEPRTAELLRASLDLLDQVSGDRLRHEMYLMLAERDPTRPLLRMDELGILPRLMPGVQWDASDAERLARLRAAGLEAPEDALTALVWATTAPTSRIDEIAERLKMPVAWRERLHELVAVRADRDALVAEGLADSALYFRLRDHQPRTLRLLATLTSDEALRRRLDHYLDDLRHRPLAVSGDDLRAAGLPPGPRYRLLLDTVHAALLDGHATSQAEQRALLARLVAEEKSDNREKGL